MNNTINPAPAEGDLRVWNSTRGLARLFEVRVPDLETAQAIATSLAELAIFEVTHASQADHPGAIGVDVWREDSETWECLESIVWQSVNEIGDTDSILADHLADIHSLKRLNRALTSDADELEPVDEPTAPIKSVTGKVLFTDGESHEFSVSEASYSQWNVRSERLGASIELMRSIQDSIRWENERE